MVSIAFIGIGIMGAARSLDLELRVSRLVETVYEDMIAHGDGEIDHSGLHRALRRRNGLM